MATAIIMTVIVFIGAMLILAGIKGWDKIAGVCFFVLIGVGTLAIFVSLIVAWITAFS